MQTVLIAHRDSAYAEQLATDLRLAGFRVISCGGPWPPRERCIRCDKGYCPLTEGADLMIYDAEMTGIDDYGTRHNLADESALAHPDVPMLRVQDVAGERSALVAEVQELLAVHDPPVRSGS